MRKIIEVEKLVENTSIFCINSVAAVPNACIPDDYSRHQAVMMLDLLPGESRGYWKHHAPGKWVKQATTSGKVNTIRANLLCDSGAEVSIFNTYACKTGCHINTSQKQECVGIGEDVYTTEERNRVKITLNGVLVYLFNVWVGSMVGPQRNYGYGLHGLVWCPFGYG